MIYVSIGIITFNLNACLLKFFNKLLLIALDY